MTDLSDLITVLVVTSPTATDPSTETIDQTLASTIALAACRLIVGADGVRPEQRVLSDAYDEKIMRLRDVMPVWRLPQWGHQANVVRGILAEVHTPLILFMEHDTPLLGERIDWNGCAQTLIDGELDLIRFHHESHILPEHSHLMIGDNDQRTRRIPYMRTVQWSQRPHLARTDWYRQIMAAFAPSSRCFVEDAVYGIVNYAWRTEGEAGWNRYKLALYADTEPTMQRSTHLDGRAGEPKGPQCFAYVGQPPPGAPAPTLGRVFE